MLTQMADSMVEQTSGLSVRRTVSAKWYIVNRWNQTHDEPIDAEAVMLFLGDEHRSSLTEEQRAFAKERKAEMYSSYSLSVCDSILYHTMRGLNLVFGLEDFCLVRSCPQESADSRSLAPCDRL